MDWLAPIDIYCERLEPGFWAEPINAISNLAFLIAAYFSYRAYRKTRGKKVKEVPLLIALLAIIGIGSFLFHTHANGWSLLADILPILFFQIVAIYAYVHRVIGARRIVAYLCIAVFVVVSQMAGELFPTFLNGSAGYLPSLAAIWIIALFIRKTHPKSARDMGIAGALFIASLTFRSLDMQVCGGFPVGVHFMWHILNGTMLYLVIHAFLLRPRPKAKQKPNAARRRKNTSRARA